MVQFGHKGRVLKQYPTLRYISIKAK